MYPDNNITMVRCLTSTALREPRAELGLELGRGDERNALCISRQDGRHQTLNVTYRLNVGSEFGDGSLDKCCLGICEAPQGVDLGDALRLLGGDCIRSPYTYIQIASHLLRAQRRLRNSPGPGRAPSSRPHHRMGLRRG